MPKRIHPAVAGAQPFQLAERNPPAGRLLADKRGKERLASVLSRYPEKRGALLPMLHYAHERRGWLSPADMEEIAEALELTPAYVQSVATFYTMYNKHPVGTWLVQVCTNISCYLNGAVEVFERFLEATGTHPGETSADGLFTCMEAECLGACGFATVAQINDEYWEELTPDRVPQVVLELRRRAGHRPAEPEG